jgi:hypothetical protein
LRRLLTHDEHRLRQHFGYIDPRRVDLARMSIGAASWCSPFRGIYGEVAPHSMPVCSATILKFPDRRSDIAKLRAEVEELRRFISVRACCW